MQKITKESEFQIRDAKEKMAKEFNLLRLQLLDRNEEIETLHKEIDSLRREIYFLRTQLNKIHQKFDIDEPTL